jgi:autotransporter strand-loop-strand O-heptosyltransferase
MTVLMHEKFIPLFERQYPKISFVARAGDIPNDLYASYKIGLFYGEHAPEWQPYDHRFVGLHRTAAHILGVDSSDEPPLLDLCAPRQISEPYICIAAQSTAQCKYWNNPRGWKEVVAFLKGCGYRVLCIDRHSSFGSGRLTNRMPEGAESWTGDRPLQERIDILKDADFFIGLPSGLSWMAWACRVPVVIISGFSDPVTEFYTPYRVSTPEGFCRACWNDMTVRFDRKDWAWCPRHKGTHQQFECSRNITSDQVINAIRMIPAFRKRTQEK